MSVYTGGISSRDVFLEAITLQMCWLWSFFILERKQIFCQMNKILRTTNMRSWFNFKVHSTKCSKCSFLQWGLVVRKIENFLHWLSLVTIWNNHKMAQTGERCVYQTLLATAAAKLPIFSFLGFNTWCAAAAVTMQAQNGCIHLLVKDFKQIGMTAFRSLGCEDEHVFFQ